MIWPIFSPAELIRLQIRTGLMLAEAQMVIGMRTLGMLGLWRVPRSETARMSDEKRTALRQAGLAATRAALAGKGPVGLAEAALKPVRRRTASNAKRLARRGPARP